MRYLVLFFISFQMSSAFSQIESWKQVSDGEVKVWLLKSNVDVSASKEERTLQKDLDFTSFDEGRALSVYQESKKKTLGMIGLTDWKMDQFTWNAVKDGYRLTVSGSYQNAQKEKISFLETHLYQKRKVIQYLHTWPQHFNEGPKVSQDFLKHELAKGY